MMYAANVRFVRNPDIGIQKLAALGTNGRFSLSRAADGLSRSHCCTCERVMKSVDCVFHLASAVGVELIMEQPFASLLTNIVGTERVLAACLKNNIRVFLASTSEVYGKSFSFPQRETDDLILADR
jgi:nucleoside-diphosphate-sugar epimerase